MLSVLILTKNEEKDLQECLNSVAWCDDIHVFDSFSDDRTVEIAKNAGARVTQRHFDNYASQRNAALNNLDFKYSWILIVDADERIPFSLASLMKEKVIQASPNVHGFRMMRRDYFRKTWLKHAQISPYYIRLVRKGKSHYHREINEVLEVDGDVEKIDGYFCHFPFSKGLSHWINKHNLYSSMEAKRWLDEQNGNSMFSLRKALFSKDFSLRRFHQKGIFYKLPGRPLLKWFYIVFARRAFLDGSAGLTYALLQAIYEYFIVIKTKELLSQGSHK